MNIASAIITMLVCLGLTLFNAGGARTGEMKVVRVLGLLAISLLLPACAPSSPAVTQPTPPATGLSQDHSPVLLVPTARPTSPPVTVPPTQQAPTKAQIPTATKTQLPIPAVTNTTVPNSVVFAVIGDYGSAGPNEQHVASLVHSWNPAFIITVGDNNYSNGAAATIDANIGQYYHDFIYPYKGTYGPGADVNRFFPALGNHDWVAKDARPYLDYFTLPNNERYYDFVSGPVHFFALDSDPHEPDGNTSTSIQGRWFQSQLAASTSCWNLAYFHHPAYSSGPHGVSDWMQWSFRAWGVDAVLTGHDHDYERLEVDGLPYFVVGLGGQSIYTSQKSMASSRVRYNRTYGAMLVTATETNILYQFISVDGIVVDRYAQDGDCARAQR